MISFEKSFFEAEVREDFYIEKDMKHAWAAQMEVLMEIDKVCKAHDIPWFADYGTLLGAIRHHGFIPWDDDMDICMKRQDYQRFLEVAPKALPKGYHVCDIHSDARWHQPFARVINGVKHAVNGVWLEQFHGCPYVVGIDIFPLDYLPKESGEREVLLILCQCVHTIKRLVKENDTVKLEQTLLRLEEYLQMKFDRTGNLTNQALRMVDKLSSLYHEEECDELAVLIGLGYNGEKPRRIEWYREMVMVPFENIQLPAPVEAEKVLESLYGDWKKIVRNAAGHDYPFYKKQKQAMDEMFEQVQTKLEKIDEKIKALEDMD